MNDVLVGDAAKLLPAFVAQAKDAGLDPVVVTDPPFNVGYHYAKYRDRMRRDDYMRLLVTVTSMTPSVVVLYPETLHELSVAKGEAPCRVVSWVYPSNTPRQHRDIGFWGGAKPDLRRVGQPYRNPRDKRVARLIAEGRQARLYDWWEVDQVKNVSAEKTAHPCQMPVEVMRRVVGVLPDGVCVIDPFCGSGTTLVAAKLLGVPYLGCDIDEGYVGISVSRLDREAAS